MSFREINHKNNEEYWERLELVMERIEAVSEEEASSVEELYRGYFFEMSELFLVLYKLAEASLSGKLAEISTLEGKKINRRLYLDVQEDYADSYANPAYAVSKMGWEYGAALGIGCQTAWNLYQLYGRKYPLSVYLCGTICGNLQLF